MQVVRGTSVDLKLQEKDLITKIGEQIFTSADEFIKQFLTYEPGKEIQFSVLRGKKN
jgi:S1-C subfamily serine protease